MKFKLLLLWSLSLAICFNAEEISREVIQDKDSTEVDQVHGSQKAPQAEASQKADQAEGSKKPATDIMPKQEYDPVTGLPKHIPKVKLGEVTVKFGPDETPKQIHLHMSDVGLLLQPFTSDPRYFPNHYEVSFPSNASDQLKRYSKIEETSIDKPRFIIEEKSDHIFFQYFRGDYFTTWKMTKEDFLSIEKLYVKYYNGDVYFGKKVYTYLKMVEELKKEGYEILHY